MSPHAYTEDPLVEQPAKAGGPPSSWSSPSGRGEDGLFAEMGSPEQVELASAEPIGQKVESNR
jgi:hypothetical protein